MVTVYSMPNCPQCTATYKALDKNGVQYQTVNLAASPDDFQMVVSLGYQTAPVVITEAGDHWAGFRPDRIKAHAQTLVAA